MSTGDPFREQRDELAEVRAALRQTWPSLTADDVAELPRTRREAVPALQERTGASLEEVEGTLSELFGTVPERHETSTVPERHETSTVPERHETSTVPERHEQRGADLSTESTGDEAAP